MLNQNTKKSFEIEFALFNCAEKMGMNNFGSLNSSLSFFYFYFATNLKKKKKKKKMACVRLQLNLPLPLYKPVRFWLDHPSPSWLTYFLDDPTG